MISGLAIRMIWIFFDLLLNETYFSFMFEFGKLAENIESKRNRFKINHWVFAEIRDYEFTEYNEIAAF